MMNRELNFSVARNNFGYVLICWCVTLFLGVSLLRSYAGIYFLEQKIWKMINIR